MSYKKKLTEAKKLITTGCLALFDRVSLLVDVFNDREFRAQEGLADDGKAADYLSEGYLPDLDWDFLDLRALMEFAPNREQWGQGKLKRLYAEMMEAHRAANTEQREKRTRTVVTQKEHEEVKTALQHEKAQVKYQRDRIGELEEENRALREEVATLKGRIQELERVARRELAAA